MRGNFQWQHRLGVGRLLRRGGATVSFYDQSFEKKLPKATPYGLAGMKCSKLSKPFLEKQDLVLVTTNLVVEDSGNDPDDPLSKYASIVTTLSEHATTLIVDPSKDPDGLVVRPKAPEAYRYRAGERDPSALANRRKDKNRRPISKSSV